VIAPHPDPAGAIKALIDKVHDLPLLNPPADRGAAMELAGDLQNTARYLPEGTPRDTWQELAHLLRLVIT
jgi:hypothetical protein